MPSTPDDLSDWQLFDSELRVSLAYARALVEPGLLTEAECTQLSEKLDQLGKEYASGSLSGSDLYSVFDSRLEALGGALAGKLLTGCTHSERLLTAFRLWLVQQIEGLGAQIGKVQNAILIQAESHVAALMPGYLHLQPAQVISCSHWLLSFFWMLARDQERLMNARVRASVMPLGSGLLAGTPFLIDRAALAENLGFAAASDNSLDAVSDLDFEAEFLFAATQLALHLSRLADEMLLYSNPSLGFISFEQGPPAAILSARAVASRLFGQLTGALITQKGLPSVYNQDSSETRQLLYASIDLLNGLLPKLTRVLESLVVQADRMWDAVDENILGSEVTDYLVARGVDPDAAQAIVVRLRTQAEQTGRPLSELDLADFQAESAVFGPDVFGLFDFTQSITRHSAKGGTAPAAVRLQIRAAANWLVESGYE